MEILKNDVPETLTDWGPSSFAVFGFIALPSTDVRSAGMPLIETFKTLDEARARVIADGLTHWEIWQGDHIVEESDPNGARYANVDNWGSW